MLNRIPQVLDVYCNAMRRSMQASTWFYNNAISMMSLYKRDNSERNEGGVPTYRWIIKVVPIPLSQRLGLLQDPVKTQSDYSFYPLNPHLRNSGYQEAEF